MGRPFDVLIQGGRLVDGTGNPPVEADLAIEGNLNRSHRPPHRSRIGPAGDPGPRVGGLPRLHRCPQPR